MELLSLSGNVADLIAPMRDIIANGYKVVSGLGENDADIRKVFDEVNLLFGTLHSLRLLASNFEQQNTSSQSTRNPPLPLIDACHRTMRKICAQLETVAEVKKLVGRDGKRSDLWPLSEADTKSLSTEVEKCRACIKQALQADGMPALILALSPHDFTKTGLLDVEDSLTSFVDVKSINNSGGGIELYELIPTPALPASEKYTLPLNEISKNLLIGELKAAAIGADLHRVKAFIRILQDSGDSRYIATLQVTLNIALQHRHFEIADFLLHNGASAIYQDEKGNAPLHHACLATESGDIPHLSICKLLLGLGASPTSLNKDDMSPLHLIIRLNDARTDDLLQLLLDAASTKESLWANGNFTACPVWCAIVQGSDTASRLLLQHCDIKVLKNLTWEGRTCLAPAAHRESSDILELLVEKGLDANSPIGYGSFAIHHAAKGHKSLLPLKTLLQHHVDYACKSQDGLNTLHLIAQRTPSDAIEKFQAIINAGGDINSLTSKNWSVLQIAVLRADDALPATINVIRFILKRQGVNINHKNYAGETALMISARQSSYDALDAFLKYGCDEEVTCHEGWTALHYACSQCPSKENTQCIRKLVEAGLQLSVENTQVTNAFELALSSVETVYQGDGLTRYQYLPKTCPDTALRQLFPDTRLQTWDRWNEKIVVCINNLSLEQLNRKLTGGRYPINFIIQHASTSTIQLLFKKGVDINVVDSEYPQTPLDAAAEYGCDEGVAEFLISNIQYPIDQFTGNQRSNALQKCCYQKDSNLVLLRKLLDIGADPTLPDRVEGTTPLMMAAGSGNVKILKLLLDRKVPVDTQELGIGRTALHWAVDGGSVDCIVALLDAGANVSIKSTRPYPQQTALHMCGEKQAWDIAEALVRYGAPKSTLELSGGCSIIHDAASFKVDHILRLILEQPDLPDLNVQDADGFTPLQYAAMKGSTSSFKLLLQAGAKLDTGIDLHGTGGIEHSGALAPNNDIRRILLERKRTFNKLALTSFYNIEFSNVLPLHRAAACGNDACIQFFHDEGILNDIEVPAQFSTTALHFAACSNHYSTVKLLLKLGANIEAVSSRMNRTPLLCAVRYQSDKAVEALLESGCNTMAVDQNGLTAHMLAIREGNAQIARLLERFAASCILRHDPSIPVEPGKETAFPQLKAPNAKHGKPINQDNQVLDTIGEEIPAAPNLLTRRDNKGKLNLKDVKSGDQLISKKKKYFLSVTSSNSLVTVILGVVLVLLYWVIVLLSEVNKTMLEIKKRTRQD